MHAVRCCSRSERPTRNRARARYPAPRAPTPPPATRQKRSPPPRRPSPLPRSRRKTPSHRISRWKWKTGPAVWRVCHSAHSAPCVCPSKVTSIVAGAATRHSSPR
ncbi:MAG TPA: hypothetical protein DGD08_13425 [Gemmatimonas aurantiaca]|uniref:Uncharacterized protein n=1 Tax=Gemmatimonas aurantiaca TaxID=173480 RepID=A0A3D4VAQ8_9BACT|nr:hypothetical protein [Gemmatimonas aurantiaca]